MSVDLDLSKSGYQKLRIHSKQIYDNNYPDYKVIAEAKKHCYPNHITATKLGAKVNLVALLDHTLQRILLTLDEEIVKSLKDQTCILLGKWGMDGASGQQTTRQKWTEHSRSLIDCDTNDDNDITDSIVSEPSDASVFMTTFVPLRIKVDDKVIWVNLRPSSVFYCRPINFKFIKECKDVVVSNYTFYEQLLNKIELYSLTFQDMTINVKFDLKCSMIDGKVCNYLSEQNASNCCNICGVGPKFVNDIPKVLEYPCKTQYYKFGFPILHCWIKFMEFILHIAYNMDFKQGTASGGNKQLQHDRKIKIQKLLKKKLQLTVDIVKQSYGTTNTGNVSRIFFSHADEVSIITDVKREMIIRLHTVLQVISQKQEVHVKKFKTFCYETAQFCVNEYPWYKMPPTVHKVLIHGSDIMQNFDAPISWFSEEAQESSNKVFRKARATLSRMFQRKATNEDTIHHLLISSNPYVSSFRVSPAPKHEELPQRVQQFIR